MNKQRKVLITITYNEMGIIIDTKAEEVAQPNLQLEQKTGRWIYDGEYKNGMLRMKCSICGTVIETFDGPSELRYCQNCGAKMEDKNEPERI